MSGERAKMPAELVHIMPFPFPFSLWYCRRDQDSPFRIDKEDVATQVTGEGGLAFK